MPQFNSMFQSNDYYSAVNGYMGSLSDEDLYGLQDRKAMEDHLRNAGIWQDSGPFNPGNEKLVDQLMEKRKTISPLVEESRRKAQEATLAEQTKKQAEVRSAQKTKAAAFQGRRGTLVTGPQGLDPVDPMGRKTLLGA